VGGSGVDFLPDADSLSLSVSPQPQNDEPQLEAATSGADKKIAGSNDMINSGGSSGGGSFWRVCCCCPLSCCANACAATDPLLLCRSQLLFFAHVVAVDRSRLLVAVIQVTVTRVTTVITRLPYLTTIHRSVATVIKTLKHNQTLPLPVPCPC